MTEMVAEIVDVIVPIYNQGIWDTPVVKRYAGDVSVNLYVCDNSVAADTRSQNARTADIIKNLTYIDMGGNRGIARAYNSALNRISGSIICVFDDDTVPSDNYMDVVRRCVVEEGVYLPVVRNSSRILSPLNTAGPAIYPVKDLKNVKFATCSAFNTGMAYTASVAKRIGYDESLFIEFVDHDFCRRAHEAGIKFHLMEEAVLFQDYSVETNSLNAALHRDSLGKADLKRYYSHSLLERLYCRLYLTYRLIRNSKKYKTLKFIRGTRCSF